MTPTNFAKRVVELTNEKIVQTLADPQIRAQTQFGRGKDNEQETRESIEEIFTRNGLFCTLANNDRINGWNKVRDMMYFDINQDPKLFPKFKIFASCKETIRVYPDMVRDNKNLEDMSKEQEDHICDGDRYLFMHTVKSSEPEMQKDWHTKFEEEITDSQDVRDWEKDT